jgi:hypothetical protein
MFLRVVVGDTVVGEGVAEGIIVEEWGYSCWRSVTEGQGGSLSGDTVVGEGVAAEGTVGGIKGRPWRRCS